jgi:hypothetical protein
VINNEMAMENLRQAKYCYTVRYEDLAMAPEMMAKRIFEFCGLEWRHETSAFLRKSTRRPWLEGYYRLRRDPIKAANRWRTELSRDQIDEISCIAEQSLLGRMYPDKIIAAVSRGHQTLDSLH